MGGIEIEKRREVAIEYLHNVVQRLMITFDGCLYQIGMGVEQIEVWIDQWVHEHDTWFTSVVTVHCQWDAKDGVGDAAREVLFKVAKEMSRCFRG